MTTLSAEQTRIPAQQQRWPGTEAELNPEPDHGEEGWTPRRRPTGKRALITAGGTRLGRPGQPVEVAAADVFLASDEAAHISGTVLGVTGGKAVC